MAWQREGFQMFGQMMDSIDDDYLRYVMHVQVVTEPAPEPDLSRASYQAPADPSQASLIEAVRSAAAAGGAAAGGAPSGGLSGDGGRSAPGLLGPAPGNGQGTPRAAGRAATGPVASPARRAIPGAAAPGAEAAGAKLGRNSPCWCGSGKKYKLCHGAT